MKKILVKFTYRLRNKEIFNKIMEEIEKKGFEIIEIEYDADKFDIDVIIEKLKLVNINICENNQIIIISNVKDVLYLWNRIYNEIGKFIYFIDKYNYNLILKDERSILKKICSLKNKSKEEVFENKIYININFENFENIMEEIIENNLIENFDVIENFNYNFSHNNYCYKKKYFFGDEILENKIIGKTLKEIEIKENQVEVNYEKIIENKMMLIYFYCYMMRKKEISESRIILLNIFKAFQKNFKDLELIKLEKMIVNSEKTTFLEKIGILSMMIFLEIETSRISKNIFDLIKLDKNKNSEMYLPILVNILSYGSFVKFIGHDNIEKEFNVLFDSMFENLTEKKMIRKNKKIAVIVDSLHNEIYSSTKLIKNIVNNILKYKPEYEIGIFVEDSFKLSEKENGILFSKLANQTPSFYFAGEHKKIFNNKVKIEYFSITGNIRDRAKRIINSILEYQPEVILSTALLSYSINKLYEYTPTIYISQGKINTRNKFDVLLYPHIKEAEIELKKKQILYDNIYPIEYGIEYNEPNEKYEKRNFGIKEKDFILVTVGIRLKIEMDSEFLEKILTQINKYENLKWYIIGVKSIEYIELKWKNLINEKVFFIEFERNILAFYKMCNLYLNPFRDGGGFSMAEAILSGVPVITLKESSAGMYYVGEENSFDKKIDYFKAIEDYYKDNNLIKKVLYKQQENIKKFKYSKTIEEIFKYIEKSNEIFNKRLSQKMED